MFFDPHYYNGIFEMSMYADNLENFIQFLNNDIRFELIDYKRIEEVKEKK
jgi:hypothetical protein